MNFRKRLRSIKSFYCRNNNKNRLKRQAFRDWRYPNTVWKNNRVASFFDTSANSLLRSAFRKATKLWSEDTCLDIYEDTCALSPDRIRVLAEEACWSDIGRLGGEQNRLAKGLLHTHSRDDRDQFITADARNFPLQLRYSVRLRQHNALRGSKNDNPSMLPEDVLYTETLGSPFISFYDLLLLNRHYNCTDRCKHSKTTCYLDGFPHPRDCSKCICPGGYGGVDCKERPAGCGEEFTATPYPQVFHASVGSKSLGDTPQEDFDKCYYWIKAPLDKRIEVKLLRFSPDDGCRYCGVEIKTQKDQRLTGYSFCSTSERNPGFRLLYSADNNVQSDERNECINSISILLNETVHEEFTLDAPSH
ncbi:unnamed protein product [Heligmosomoides polygyrus]|uniref:ZnMc domain-containing protein n=1 Tax=Heligmosomoides polygyrus TaxID=6339 RepID=A0A183FR37_HELPZ|nr:unnamed protein product [Heligmosomoides polygyrus]